MTYKRILVPVDGSRASLLGLREGIKLAQESGASLQLVHVVDQHAIIAYGGRLAAVLLKDLHDAGLSILRKAEGAVRKQRLVPQSVLIETATGPVANAIIQRAKKARADLIVIGTHGRKGLRRALMGSDAEQVVRLSPVPVLMVRSGRQR